ncbi:MAG: zinc ABC transporter substrate-binding protein [Candidimonas sp.]
MRYIEVRARKAALMLMIGIVAYFACSGHAGAAAGKIQVVATTGMLADAMQEVGGEFVEVAALMGSGVDPHTYRQTRSDIAALRRADLIVWHGLRLEAQLQPLLDKLSARQTVVALAQAVPKERLLSDANNPDWFDPHIWMDPGLWRLVVDAARDALIAKDPEHERQYRDNAKRYNQAIAAAHESNRKLLSSVPPEKRVLVTAHDAFRYFGRLYGYEVLGIQGISTESEASLHRIEQLVRLLVERRINAIFVEFSVSDRAMRALVEGAASRGHRVVIGGELYSDAMGRPGTREGTYIGMIEHNARTISQALIQAPAKP